MLNDKGKYRNIRYVAKGLELTNVKLPIAIEEKICCERKSE